MAKNKTNKFLTGAITATMVASAVAPVAAAADTKFDFTDVKEGTSHYDNIIKAAERGLMTGYLDGSFKPLQEMSRGQVVKALAKYISGKDGRAPEAYVKNHKLVDKVEAFNDVPADHRDKELYLASLIVKDNGAFTGDQNNLKAGNKILRQHMAKVVVEAFELEKVSGSDVEVTDMDNVPEQYREYVEILAQNEVTKSDDGKFKPANNLTRQQMASFLNRAFDVVHGEDSNGIESSGITSVKAINDTTVEVEFAEAVDRDFVREAERNGEYFRLYLEGDSVSSDDAIKSGSINFSSDRKSATFTLGEMLVSDSEDLKIESGKRYYVALTDSDSAAAEVKYSYGPSSLKASATKPNFEVNATSDKIIVNFGEKMKSSALKASNYEVYDNGGRQLETDLRDFVTVNADDEGEWVDASTKTAVEFKLDDDNGLKAGETYKLRVKKDVQTDDNKTLSDSDRTISVKTPSISDAKPKAVSARAIGEREIVVSFDQDISNIQKLMNQVDVKTATNKTIDVSDIARNGDVKNEIKITVGNGDANKLKIDEAYKVSLPSNIVTNSVFTNAANDSISNITAKAQENKEIKSVRASLKADAKDRNQANLHLEFDQRPDIELFTSSTGNNEVKIVDGSKVYEFQGGATVKYTGDKSIVIENVEEVFERSSKGFVPERSKNYTFEIGSGQLKTDAFNGEGVKNQSKLETTFGGVSVSKPAIDKVTLVSEKEIKIEFKDDITNVNTDDVQVAGYERFSNGKFDIATFTGDDITASTSGKTLTLKTTGDRLFNTSYANTNIEIAANTFSAKDSQVSNNKIKIAKDVSNSDVTTVEENDFIDNAGPVLVGANENASDGKVLRFTFTENVKTKGDGNDIAKLFSVSNAANNSVGETTNLDTNDSNLGWVKFNKDVIEEDTVLSRIEIKYSGSNTFYIQDKNGNKAKQVTIKGVKAN